MSIVADVCAGQTKPTRIHARGSASTAGEHRLPLHIALQCLTNNKPQLNGYWRHMQTYELPLEGTITDKPRWIST